MNAVVRIVDNVSQTEAQRSSLSAPLDWPVPHPFRLASASVSRAEERCLVTLNDGRKLAGVLARMDTTAGFIELRAEHDPGNRVIPFSAFKSVSLVRPVELEPSDSGEPRGLVGSRREKCTVRFKDGDVLSCDSVGVVQRKFGLYLFLSNYSSNVLRWFIPAQALESYGQAGMSGSTPLEAHLVVPRAVEARMEEQRELRRTRVEDYLQRHGAVTIEQLEAALKKQKMMRHLRLGDALVQEGLISEKQRDDAVAAQAVGPRKPLGEILVERGLIDRETVRCVLIEKLGIPVVNLRRFQFQPSALKAIPAELARRHTVMPLHRNQARIAIAMENPMDWQVLEELRFFSVLKIDPVMAPREDLLAAIRQFYGGGSNVSELVARLGDEEPQADAIEEVVTESDNALVQLVNRILEDAIGQQASDIHVEAAPAGQTSRVRLRKDGVLVPYVEIPPSFRGPFVSRVKIMAGLDISERRRPQDGKVSFDRAGADAVELRVLTMPTAAGGEDIVMRVLGAPRKLVLEDLGLAAPIVQSLRSLALKPHGLLLVCGPTGSGKTTTLHSVLGHVNTPDRKIWTVEDPVEITQPGLCQVQVNPKLGMTFPEVLRSFMRGDPDVIMVGETRDAETAATAVAASLTGHLVLSTMHTNGAVESVARLLDFGVDPFNFSDALQGILAQRLVRRLCPACRVPHVLGGGEIRALAQEYCIGTALDPHAVEDEWRVRHMRGGALVLHAPGGCDDCDGAGYKGRIGVHELLVPSAGLRAAMLARRPVAELARIATSEGMITLRQDALDKALLGVIDVAQARSVVI